MNRNRKSISFGDKIFARVTRNGHTIFNFVSEKVANMSQLISELRFAIKDVSGLVMIHIRNFNQGWGEERPLMLYPGQISEYKNTSEKNYIAASNTSSRTMFFPWETH